MAQALENAGNADDGEYRGYLARIQSRFDSAISRKRPNEASYE